MNKLEAEQRMLETEQRYQRGELSKKDAINQMKEIEKQVKKSKTMNETEKKELTKTILKYVLELIIQILTLFIPAMCGKSIMKLKK